MGSNRTRRRNRRARHNHSNSPQSSPKASSNKNSSPESSSDTSSGEQQAPATMVAPLQRFYDTSSSSSPYEQPHGDFSSLPDDSGSDSMYRSSSSQSEGHNDEYVDGHHEDEYTSSEASTSVSSEVYEVEDEDYQNRYSFRNDGGLEQQGNIKNYNPTSGGDDSHHIVSLNTFDNEGDSTIHHSANTTIDNSNSNSNSTQVPTAARDISDKSDKNQGGRKKYRGRRKQDRRIEKQDEGDSEESESGNGHESAHDSDDNEEIEPLRPEKKFQRFIGKILPALGGKRKTAKKATSSVNDKGKRSGKAPKVEASTKKQIKNTKEKNKAKMKFRSDAGEDGSESVDSFSIQVVDDGSSIASEPSQLSYSQYSKSRKEKYSNPMPGVLEEEEEESHGTDYKDDRRQGRMEPLVEDDEEDQTVDDSSRFNYMSNDDSSGMHDIHALIQQNNMKNADKGYYRSEKDGYQPFIVPPSSKSQQNAKKKSKKSKPSRSSTSTPPIQNVHASHSVATSNASDSTYPGIKPQHKTSPGQFVELQAEVIKLRLLVTLMMQRMELYERQSDCLLEASVEHDEQWKKATMERFEQSSKRTVSDSEAVVRLSTIKGLIEERAATDQWIKQLEMVHRGYQERVVTTQAQLKSLRYEQVYTNKKIIDLKREQNKMKKHPKESKMSMPAGEETTSNSYRDSRAEEKADDYPTRSTPPRQWSAGAKSTNTAISSLYTNSYAGQSLLPEENKKSLVEDMISEWKNESHHVSDAINPARVTMAGGIANSVASSKGWISQKTSTSSSSGYLPTSSSSSYGTGPKEKKNSGSKKKKKKKKKEKSRSNR